jgi:hypothetical protein
MMDSLLWALCRVMCVLIAFSWMTHNRLRTAELSSVERALRLENRLLELAEKLDKRDKR